jgi:glycosyltransferase involved in cell wall biosynthesis
MSFFRRSGIDPTALLGMRRFLKSHQADVVVAHGSEPLKYLALAGVAKERLVYLKIGGRDPKLRGVRRKLYRSFLRRAGHVVAVSRDAADEAIQLGVDRARVTVIPNGRDPSFFRPAVRQREDGPVRLVFVGHLDAAKRPMAFVNLVSSLQRDRAIGASIAGSGPLYEEVRRSAGAHGIRLHGGVEDIREVFAQSDLLVFTGEPPEGMPGVLIEAGMSGIPVVTTDVPGARDVVVNGDTGFVVPVEDFDALVHAAKVLIDDAQLRIEFGAAARAHCAKEFNIHDELASWRELFDRIMDDSCESPA